MTRAARSMLGALVLVSCATAENAPGGERAAEKTPQGGKPMLSLTSPAFSQGGEIPSEHTCEGGDRSPPLAWSSLPPGTHSLALIVDDPDAPDPRAPKTTWVHWVIYNLPPTAKGLPAGAAEGGLPEGARQGMNDWKRPAYGGPCPPVGRHRYFHKLYALDTVLPDLGTPTKSQLEKAMAGHVLAHVELVGTYQKTQR